MALTDPDNSTMYIIVYQEIANYCVQSLKWIFILEDCLKPLYLQLSTNDTHALFLVVGMKEYYLKNTAMH